MIVPSFKTADSAMSMSQYKGKINSPMIRTMNDGKSNRQMKAIKAKQTTIRMVTAQA